MKKEDILLWVSTVGAVLFMLMIVLDRNKVIDIGYASLPEFFVAVLFIFIPMAILLWVSKMKNIIYTKFFKFSRVYLLTYLFIYLISPSNPDFIIRARGEVAMILSLIYSGTGIVYLFFLFIKHRKIN
jgi:hypothetical protein